MRANISSSFRRFILNPRPHISGYLDLEAQSSDIEILNYKAGILPQSLVLERKSQLVHYLLTGAQGGAEREHWNDIIGIRWRWHEGSAAHSPESNRKSIHKPFSPQARRTTFQAQTLNTKAQPQGLQSLQKGQTDICIYIYIHMYIHMHTWSLYPS